MNGHWEILTQFGLAGVIFGGFLMVLKWVFTVNNNLLSNMDEERKTWQAQHREIFENIARHNTHTQEFQRQVRDEHRASQAEHAEMIKTLGRINGYKP